MIFFFFSVSSMFHFDLSDGIPHHALIIDWNVCICSFRFSYSHVFANADSKLLLYSEALFGMQNRQIFLDTWAWCGNHFLVSSFNKLHIAFVKIPLQVKHNSFQISFWKMDQSTAILSNGTSTKYFSSSITWDFWCFVVK